MEDSVIAGAILTVAGAGGAWLKSHEQRIAIAETVIKKMDKLVDLLIEEKLKEKR